MLLARRAGTSTHPNKLNHRNHNTTSHRRLNRNSDFSDGRSNDQKIIILKANSYFYHINGLQLMQNRMGNNRLSLPDAPVPDSTDGTLAVIDLAVPARAALAGVLVGRHRICLLGDTTDPFQSLADALSRPDAPATSVHVFSHGEPGVLHLGGERISLATLQRHHAGIAGLRRALAGRSLVLYGCSVGRDEVGRRFVETLSRVLVAPVLASSTPTGGRLYGGDWKLDVAAGGAPDAFPCLIDPQRAARWPGLLAVNVTSTLGDASAGTLRAAAAAVDQIVRFSNLGATATINLAASPTFTNGAATSFGFTGTTNSLTIGGSDIVADSHLYFDVSAGQSLTLNSGVSFTGGSFVLQTAGGGTIALNGSISGTSRVWVLGGTTAEIGTTTSAPLIDILGNSTVRFTTSGAYTSNIEVEDTATIDTGANTVTISGTVTDDGTNVLAKTGTGTLTLTGTNTASGSMTVSQGTLSVAGDGNLSAGTVTINGGTLAVTGATTIDNAIVLGASNGTVNVGANVTMSGVVSGAGNLTKTGASTLTLSGTNTYTGTTTVTGGTLSVSTDSNLGTGNVALNGGGLTVTGATTIDNDISGTSGLTKSGSGTVTLSGTNTYSGGTTINGGTLQVSGGNALADAGAVSVASGATLDLSNTNETIGSLTGSGTLNIGSGTLTLTDSASTTFSGTISGSGTIAGGGTYTVASGATLGGTSTFSTAVTVASGGTIAPGNSPGTISTGNLTLANGSTATMEVDGTAAGTGYDQINVTGTVTISNATLNVVLGYTPAAGDSYTLVNNDGVDAVTGTFSGLAEGATLTAGGRTLQISYVGGTGNDVTLTDVTPQPGGSDGGGASVGGETLSSGGTSGDVLRGTTGNDTLYGFAGNDTLSGGIGLDILYGNLGDDLLYGNQDADSLCGGQGADTAYGGTGDDLLWGNRDDDHLYGNQGADRIYGNEGDDRIRGDDGSDTLYGGQGADTLSGGAGDDRLFGNSGADVFRFGEADGADALYGFSIGEDRLMVAANANGTGIASADNLLARLFNDGAGNTVLDLGGGHSVTLVGLSADQFGTDSFLVG
ncbi:DUF4347 domain-containing protein [Thalassobaculum litoreum]|nr:DUF4347 domain-containing protein [Thalassobaculum litoreum]